jgi:hypothetical protein
MTNNEEEPGINDLEITEIQTAIDEIVEQVEDFGFEPIPVELETGSQPRVYCDATWDAIITTNNHHHPTIFQKAGSMVRIVKTGDNRRIIQPIDYQTLHNAITYRINYVKRLTQKEILKWIDEHPMAQPDPQTAAEAIRINLRSPKDIVSDVLNRHNFDGLPELIGIVTTPIMNLQTGNINFQSHYDPVAQMYFGRIPSLQIPQIPENPTPEDVLCAVNLLKESIVDFPFVKEVDRINALASIITATIRPSIPGNVPIYIIDKPAPGTGAGLLCDTISIIVTGELARAMTLSKTGDEEWKKVITSVLRSGNLLSIIDNIEDKVSLPSLSSLVTCGLYSDRILATNQMFTSPHRNVWILNGNNVQIGGDLGRRSYMSRMDANLKQPWLRDGFTHDQIPWVTENRGRILSAIFTVVRSWVRAGAIPATTDIPPMGSFEQWRSIIGGIMQHIKCPQFNSNSEEMMETTDADTPQWDLFISTLFERVADWDKKDRVMLGGMSSKAKTATEVEFTTHDIIDILYFEKDPYNVGDKTPLGDTLPDTIADGYIDGKNTNRVIARHLRTQLGRVFSKGLKLEKSVCKTDNKTQWKLIKSATITTNF